MVGKKKNKLKFTQPFQRRGHPIFYTGIALYFLTIKK